MMKGNCETDPIEIINTCLGEVEAVMRITLDYFSNWRGLSIENDQDALAYEVSRTLDQLELLMFMAHGSLGRCNEVLDSAVGGGAM